MVRRIVLVTLLATWGVTVAASVEAADRSPAKALSKAYTLPQSNVARSCTSDDLLGSWQLVGFDSPYRFRDPRAPYLLPYQVFQYADHGSMKSAHSSKPIVSEAETLFATIPQAMSYRVQLGGVVTLSREGQDGAVETWRCTTMTEDRMDVRRQMSFQRGDLIMTLTGREGRTLFVRHLRRVSS
ncbi:MAG: hypothetical protein KF814_11555 [Nitrospiraceae bacterium]|nr:hypothetical protein [Nitrospiraceae bacterium]